MSVRRSWTCQAEAPHDQQLREGRDSAKELTQTAHRWLANCVLR